MSAVKFSFATYYKLVAGVLKLSANLKDATYQGGNAGELNVMADVLTYLRNIKSVLDYFDVPITQRKLQEMLGIPEGDYSFDLLSADLNELVSRLNHELEETLTIIVPKSKVHYCKEEHLFGEAVATVFPEQVDDIAEAGKCFAADCNTACVMHLMRVVEVGVKKLARKVRIAKGDIEGNTWGGILNKIDKVLATWKEKPKKTPAETKAIEAYPAISLHLRSIKNVWRDPTMHGNPQYLEPEARMIFDTAKLVMQELARLLQPKTRKKAEEPGEAETARTSSEDDGSE